MSTYRDDLGAAVARADALQKELDEVKTNVCELMQNVAKLEVALVVDAGVGDNWDQAH